MRTWLDGPETGVTDRIGSTCGISASAGADSAARAVVNRFFIQNSLAGDNEVLALSTADISRHQSLKRSALEGRGRLCCGRR